MKKVLVVEDDLDINKALTIRLKASGYEVLSAQDGLQGFLTAVRERPDLLLLDVSMPAGDGFTVIERLRENADIAEIPFIVLTASKRPDYMRTAQDLGAYAYFEKPFESAALLRTIDEALAGEPAVQP